MLLEICAANLSSALAAEAAGAHRIELCCALDNGGLTPSAGTISTVTDLLSIPVMVLIRPREGNFFYSPAEVTQMCADIRYCRSAGAAGVVIGALTPDNNLDIPVLETLLEAADGLDLTFHRAFDFTADPESALETLIGYGFTRVLSSGQADSAWDGRARLHDWVRQASGRIAIMPGAGVHAGNIRALTAATGATEMHCSAKEWVDQGSTDRKLGGLETGYWASSTENIRTVLKEMLA